MNQSTLPIDADTDFDLLNAVYLSNTDPNDPDFQDEVRADLANAVSQFLSFSDADDLLQYIESLV